MKFENLVLRGLFVACLLAGGVVLGAMVTQTPASTQIATHSNIGAMLLAAPIHCAVPADGVLCPSDSG